MWQKNTRLKWKFSSQWESLLLVNAYLATTDLFSPMDRLDQAKPSLFWANKAQIKTQGAFCHAVSNIFLMRWPRSATEQC